MFINSIMSSIQHSTIQLYEKGGRYSTQIPRIAKNISKVALPIVALLTLSNLGGAEAGPVSYGVCVSACLTLATPVLTPACILACVPVGLSPFLP